MNHAELQQLAEDELQKQAEEAGLTFGQFAQELIYLCNLGRSPTSWNDAAEMWLSFIESSIDIEDEDEIVAHVAELIKDMLE